MMIKFLKFGAIGVINTIITIISFMFLVSIGMNYILANVIAYGLGVINSFYWNNNWVFKTKSKKMNVFFKFVTVNLITLGVNTLFLFFLVKYFFMLPVIAQIIATGIGMVINFILNKKWTFHS